MSTDRAKVVSGAQPPPDMIAVPLWLAHATFEALWLENEGGSNKLSTDPDDPKVAAWGRLLGLRSPGVEWWEGAAISLEPPPPHGLEIGSVLFGRVEVGGVGLEVRGFVVTDTDIDWQLTELLYTRGPAAAPDQPCPTCHGRGCEYGCGHCHESPSVAGPDAHRQCVTCHGSGVAAAPDDEGGR